MVKVACSSHDMLGPFPKPPGGTVKANNHLNGVYCLLQSQPSPKPREQNGRKKADRKGKAPPGFVILAASFIGSPLPIPQPSPCCHLSYSRTSYVRANLFDIDIETSTPPHSGGHAYTHTEAPTLARSSTTTSH